MAGSKFPFPLDRGKESLSLQFIKLRQKLDGVSYINKGQELLHEILLKKKGLGSGP